MATAFDETELLGRVDNDIPFLSETVQMLASDGRDLMKQIHGAVAAGDGAAVGRSAHALKGMISNFCSAGTQECASELERLGRSGDLASAPAASQRLEERLETLIAELLQFVRAKS
jgi:HPt (histidine-containing phosphotransfer) domain-containing protein